MQFGGISSHVPLPTVEALLNTTDEELLNSTANPYLAEGLANLTALAQLAQLEVPPCDAGSFPSGGSTSGAGPGDGKVGAGRGRHRCDCLHAALTRQPQLPVWPAPLPLQGGGGGGHPRGPTFLWLDWLKDGLSSILPWSRPGSFDPDLKAVARDRAYRDELLRQVGWVLQCSLLVLAAPRWAVLAAHCPISRWLQGLLGAVLIDQAKTALCLTPSFAPAPLAQLPPQTYQVWTVQQVGAGCPAGLGLRAGCSLSTLTPAMSFPCAAGGGLSICHFSHSHHHHRRPHL